MTIRELITTKEADMIKKLHSIYFHDQERMPSLSEIWKYSAVQEKTLLISMLCIYSAGFMHVLLDFHRFDQYFGAALFVFGAVLYDWLVRLQYLENIKSESQSESVPFNIKCFIETLFKLQHHNVVAKVALLSWIALTCIALCSSFVLAISSIASAEFSDLSTNYEHLLMSICLVGTLIYFCRILWDAALVESGELEKLTLSVVTRIFSEGFEYLKSFFVAKLH